MDNAEFDRALIASAFVLIADRGWSRLSIADAARQADLPLDRARARFPGRAMVLARFGRLADQAALALAPSEGAPRDRLFDMLMRRIDVLQSHRAGVLALLRGLPAKPLLTLMLTAASERSMGWMLQAAGVSATGPLGHLRAKGLLAVWLWTLRAWRGDESVDLAATMAALDTALARAERAAGWFPGGGERKGAFSAPPAETTDGATHAEAPPADPPGESSPGPL
jgi:hypothetical protein